MPSDLQNYIAIEASESLVGTIKIFIETLEDNSLKPDLIGQTELLVNAISELTEESVHIFLTEATSHIKLKPVSQKIINFCGTTCTKITRALAGKIFKKATNKELKILADFWKQSFIQVKHADDIASYVITPISTDFAKKFSIAMDSDPQTLPHTSAEERVQVINEMIDIVMDDLYLVQTRMVKMSFISHKALNVGIDTVEKAIHGVMHKVVKNLEGEELDGFIESYKATHLCISDADKIAS